MRKFLYIIMICTMLFCVGCGGDTQEKQRTQAAELIEQGDYSSAIELLTAIEKPEEETAEMIQLALDKQKLADVIEQAERLASQGKYDAAIFVIQDSGIDADELFVLMKKYNGIIAEAKAKQDKVCVEARELLRGYYYDEALAVLDNSGLTGDIIDACRAEINAEKAALVKYEGQMYHVFFHSLIIDTELAFDNKGHSAQGYNEWMTTVSEFKKMLPLLQDAGFILYDITWMSEMKDGQRVAKDIYLPPGKKPLIISIDDVNYYDYMKPDGFADRLELDANGKLCTAVIDRNGVEHLTYDGDVMPILDAYVEAHPEFSFRGAKGIVALTGYQGAFGYRISDPDWYTDEEFKALQDKVRAIADTLYDTGWQIACHSYTHNQYWNTKKITMSQMKSDLERWDSYIASCVGKTEIFISPFGVSFSKNDERMDYIVSMGYNIYCPVSAPMKTNYYGSYMTNERLNLDGFTMIKHPERISEHFFDPALVLDPSRPPMQ